MSTVFRVEKTANYTVMSNTHLKDRRLSFKAKGLLSVILSLPPDWDYTVTGLAIIAADGVDSVKTAVKELEKYGYIVRKQLRDELGRMARNEYRVYESPADNPDFVSEEQKTAENSAEKPMQKGTTPKKKRKESQSVYPSAENPPADKSAADNPEADTIQKLNNEKGYNLKSKAYIFVKPILLNEKEAIDEAIETARYCAENNVDRLSFCPATIHGGTLIERMWRKGAYQPPWIWSCIEIINTVRHELNIPALLDTSGFGSRRGPYNCKKCNKDLKHMIISNNLTQEPIEYDCDCKNEWLAEINNADMNKSTIPVKHLPLY